MSIVWTEINQAAPEFSIVGRNDGPATSPGDAAGAVVQFLSNYTSTLATNRRIREALRGLLPLVRQLIHPGSHDGVLAVAHVELARHGEMQGQNLRECFIAGGAFPNPQHAIHHHRRQPRLRAAPQSPIGNITARYFWGTQSS